MDPMKLPNPHASRGISRSLFQATKLPKESSVRRFKTQAFGAVVLTGGLYDVSWMDDIANFVGWFAIDELLSDEMADKYDPPEIVAWSEPRRSDD